MDTNTGGAKPKTTTASTNNISRQGGTNGSGSMQAADSQTRNRSPRQENGSIGRSSGGALRVMRSSRGTDNSNNSSISNNTANSSGDSSYRRSSVPSLTRRYYSSQTQSNASPRPAVSDSPSSLRGQPRNISRYTSNNYRRPLLSQLNAGARNGPPALTPAQSTTGDSSASKHPSQLEVSSSDDSDSESCSPSSPREWLPRPPRSASLNQLSAQQNDARPVSSSPDAMMARVLQQHDADLMLQRDEELARQLQEEINGDPPPLPLARSLAMFSSRQGGRQRYFPNIPGRQEGGRGPRHRDRLGHEGLPTMRASEGGARRGRGLRFLLMAPGARHSSEPESDLGLGLETGAISPDDDARLPDVFDSEDVGGDLDPPDDFLNMMDPSLMLLMLLLRAPDTLHHNDAGIDLDDYEGLWELAERLGEVRQRGISSDQLSQLPTHKFKSQNCETLAAAAIGNPQCPICLVDFENGDCLRCPPCKHDFHRDCIDEWLKRNATCPICREDVKPDKS